MSPLVSPLDAETPRALFGDAVDALRDLKRAYAGLIKTWRPDANPGEFRHIRGLYEEAMARLERAGSGPVPAPDGPDAPPRDGARADAAPAASPPLADDPAVAWAAWEAREAQLYARDPEAWAGELRRMVRHAAWELPQEALSGLVDRVNTTPRLDDEVADALTMALCDTLAWQAAAADPRTTALAGQVRAAVRAHGAERLRLLAPITLDEPVTRRHPGLASLVYRAIDEVTGRSRALLAVHRGSVAGGTVPPGVLAELVRPRAELEAADQRDRQARRYAVDAARAARRNGGCSGATVLFLAMFAALGAEEPLLALLLAVLAAPLASMGYHAWRDEEDGGPVAPPGLSPADEAKARAAEAAAVLTLCRAHGLWLHELAIAAEDRAPGLFDTLLADPLSDLPVVSEAHFRRADLGGPP